MLRIIFAIMTLLSGLAGDAMAQSGTLAWKTSWVASAQGPYPLGNPSAQPDQRFAFPDPAAGANDQSFRLILRPSLWGRQARIRLTNAFGTRPVTFDDVHIGLQLGSAALVPGSNRPATFAGKPSLRLEPGAFAWSDPVELPFASDPASPLLQGRKLAVSLHVAGESGPMTWHAKALQTSYVTAPRAGAKGSDEGEDAFINPTASWFFVDALDMQAPADTPVVVAFGDSITDGTASTMNGDDRWPDVLARRLSRYFGVNRVAVVNAGIGGNQIAGPAEYSPAKPFPGGPAAVQRLERDVLSLSGVTSLIWLEGINDFSRNGNAATETVQNAMRDGIAKLRARGIRVVGATVVSALGSTSPAHGHPEQDEKRKALNAFIRSPGSFDAVVDFDAATLDPASGGLKAAFVPEATTGGPGDKLHPNRTGYQAMGFAIDPAAVVPGLKRQP
ncbi:GDSL-type esterase/lipase family protein [Bosea psychrotolerans]|uniref:Lysophospholipase L1-like esterase n=1 Tax=Bosea psychrotolerans TaxID=1871628 RepID=A0A2S4M9V1_9HYPH|nr:GDSL-type esterase/lipase family protein [Bosea psychrotolerans]POR51389.1 lysophospholipase L1-like esterase [Bosea psychrotolerans]